MTDPQALIFAYVLAEDSVRQLDWNELQAGFEPGQGERLWVHLNRLAPEGRTWLETSGKASDLVCDVLFQEDSRPRAFNYEDGMVVNLRGANLTGASEPTDLISLRIYADQKLLVTTRGHSLRAAEDLRQRIEGGIVPSTNGAMVTFLADRLTQRLEPIVQDLEDQVDALEEDMLDQNTPPPKLATALFRRSVLSMRRYISPQREAISALIRDGGVLLDEDDRLRLRETQDVIYRLSEQLDMIRERAVTLQEQIVEIRAEAMNQRLFVLAIISAIFLPLGFVTGLFGVNVGGMPGVESGIAFAILCGAMIAMVGLLFVAFKKMKWL